MKKLIAVLATTACLTSGAFATSYFVADYSFPGVPCFPGTSFGWSFTAEGADGLTVWDVIDADIGGMMQYEVIFSGVGTINMQLDNCAAGTEGAAFSCSGVPDDGFAHYYPEGIVEPVTTFCDFCSGPEIELSDESHDFSQVVVGATDDWTLTIRNYGQADLEVTSIVSDEPVFTTDFVNPRLTIAPGDSADVLVTFAPTDVTSYAGTLIIDSNDASDPIVTCILYGEGTASAEPDIDLSTDLLDFGVVGVGLDADLDLTIYNVGTADLNVTDISSDDPVFTVDWGPRLTIPPGGSSVATVTFAPTNDYIYSATLTITSDDPDEGTVGVTLAGEGELIPDIDLPLAVYDFGQVTVGESDTWDLVINNVGTADLEVTDISSDNPVFTTDFPRLIIPAGGSVVIVVTFSPDAEQAYAGTLTINNNDPDENPTFVDLVGDGIGATVPDIHLPEHSHDFGPVTIGENAYWDLTINNVGDADLEISDISSDNPVFTTDFGPRLTIAPGGFAIVAVTFTPADETVYYGSLLITSNDPDEPIEGVGLQGEGVPVPEPDIDLSATAHDFGQVVIGSLGEWDLIIYNNGTAELEVTDISSDEPAFTTDFPRFIIQPGGSTLINVTFTPLLEQVYTGTLTITSDDPDEPTVTVDLTGEGIPTPLPDIDLPVTLLEFGAVVVGETLDILLAINNVGTADLEVTDISSDEPAFTVIYGPRVTIPPDDGILVMVTFAPTAEQVYTGTLTITSDDPDEPTVTVDLTGEGTSAAEPDIDLSATAYDFGEVMVGTTADWDLIISNLGNADLEVTDITSDEPAFTTDFPRLIIPAGGSVVIVVTFSPDAEQAYAGTLTINSDDPDENPTFVDLVGDGIGATVPDIHLPEHSHDFGPVTIGENAYWDLTINNVGDADLEISDISSDNPVFTTDFGPRLTIAPGGFALVMVTFAPTAEQVYTGTLTITSDDPDEPTVTVDLTGEGTSAAEPDIDLSATAYDFGEVMVGSTADWDLIISNLGNADLEVTDITSDEPAFTTDFPRLIIPAGGSVVIVVTFSPDAEQAYAGTLTINSDDPDEPTLTVDLAGEGIPTPLPDIDLPVTLLEFGAVVVGETLDILLAINNVGTADLEVTDISSDEPAFTVDYGLRVTIPPDDGILVLVTFAPTAEQVYTGTLTITSDDPDEPTVTVDLTGEGTSAAEPDIDLSATAYDFGEVMVGSTADWDLIISNLGNADLEVTDITSDEPAFTTDFPRLIIPAGGSTSITVTFTPAAEQVYAGTLTITSDDPDEPTVTVDLAGEGIPENNAPLITLPDNFQFDENGELVVDFVAYVVDIDGDDLTLYCEDGVNIFVDIVDLVVTFTATPDWFGEETFTFTVEDEHGADASDDVLVIVNHVPVPDLMLSADFWDYGLVQTGTTEDWDCIILNMGDGDLEITGVSSDNPAFTTDFTDTIVITPSQTGFFTITFAPVDPVVYEGTVTIVSNDPDGDAHVDLAGEGWDPQPPAPFSLLAPADGSMDLPFPITFSWEATTDPDPGDAVDYVFYIFADAGLEDTLLVVEVGDATTYELLDLEAEASCYWHVLARDTNTDGTVSSETWSFGLEAVSPLYSGVPDDFTIANLYPNPFNPEVTVVFGVPRPAQIKSSFYDMSGRLVATIEHGLVQPGYQTFTWQPTGATGIYFLQMTADNDWRETRRLIYLK